MRTEVLVTASMLTLFSVPLGVSSAQDNRRDVTTISFEGLNRAADPGQADRVAASLPATDAASASDAVPEAKPATVRIKVAVVVGQSKSVVLDDFIKKVVIDNPELVEADVNKNTLNELRVTGRKSGIAEVMVTDRAGKQQPIDVTINQDVSPLQMALSKLYPESNIEVIPATDQSVMVRGFVEDAASLGPIVELTKQYYPNVISRLVVVGPQQVQLRVMIAEVNRTKLQQLGFNLFFSDVHGGKTFTFTGPAIPGDFAPGSTLTFEKINSDTVVRGFLQALKQENLAKILAEPTIVAFSGRAAKINIGGEFPVLIPQQQGAVNVTFREFGTKLDVTPIVLGGGRIRLEVRPELSDRNDANGIDIAGTATSQPTHIPGIETRYVDTSVELNTGESFVIGGLLRTDHTATTNKVPYLGDVPIVGAAFRNVSYKETEKELMIMVTPELVEPLKASQKPCAYPGSESTSPTKGELFWNGNVESAPCNSCEIPRRQQLRQEGGYGRPKEFKTDSPDRSVAGRVIKGVGTGSVNREAVMVRETQRPGNLPDLIGPLGYDRGR